MAGRRVPCIECKECDVGRASGLGQGQFCPFIERAIPAGAVIYEIGAPAERVWFVRAGTVVLTGGGRARAVRFPGGFIGLEMLVSPSYLDRAEALGEVSLCGATRDGIDGWLGARGSPARTALELTLRARLSERAPDSATDGPALGRLARWLLDEGRQGVDLELPRQVIADLLGMRPETLSRALAELVRRGAIATTRTTLAILDAARLEETAAEASRGD